MIHVEACVESAEAAVAAVQGGAHRIELCANLAVGGTSPGTALLEECLSRVTIPVFVMIRPRAGHFHYSAVEQEEMLQEIQRAKAVGAGGIVTGALRPDRTVAERFTREMIAVARPLPVTFHRAFDECPDADQALETVIALGATRVLTSGRAATAPDGAATIAKLVQLAAERIAIVAGGGIAADNVAELVRASGVHEVHLSTKDADKIRRVIEALTR